MARYELTLDAEHDLLDIAIYTVETWGLAQADKYEAALVRHFEGLGRGEVRSSTPISHRPELRVSRCLHHYVFSLHDEKKAPLILAILHEKMDLMTRLAGRLGAEQPPTFVSEDVSAPEPFRFKRTARQCKKFKPCPAAPRVIQVSYPPQGQIRHETPVWTAIAEDQARTARRLSLHARAEPQWRDPSPSGPWLHGRRSSLVVPGQHGGRPSDMLRVR